MAAVVEAAVVVVVQVTKTENLQVVVTAEIAVAAAKAAVTKAIVIHLQVAATKAEAAAQVQQVRNHRVAGVKDVRLRVDVHQAVLTEKNVLTPEKRRSGNQSFNLTVFKLYPD